MQNWNSKEKAKNNVIIHQSTLVIVALHSAKKQALCRITMKECIINCFADFEQFWPKHSYTTISISMLSLNKA